VRTVQTYWQEVPTAGAWGLRVDCLPSNQAVIAVIAHILFPEAKTSIKPSGETHARVA
jgi:hypothetical protein